MSLRQRAMQRLRSSGLRRRARRLGRLRWVTKVKVLRHNEASPLRWWRYVLLDPEVDSFSYAIANEDELAATLAPLLGRPAPELSALIAEAHADATLRAALRQPAKRWLWAKRQPPLRGYSLALWTVVRTLRPAVVVETGVLDGLSSTVILAALERNGEGTLISFDVMPGAGALVPDWLRTRWELVYANQPDALEDTIGERRIALLSSDSLQEVAQVRAEVEAALRHADDEFVVMTASGLFDVLRWLDREVVRFSDQPRDHFYAGEVVDAVRIR